MNPLQPAPFPVGEGWGEGISQNCSNLSQHLHHPNTSLAACCPLSNSLPRERGWAAVGVKCCCKEKRLCSSLHVGCVRYARTRSPFSLQPQPTACVPCGTHSTDGFKGRLKKHSRRLFHLPCDKRLPEKFRLLIFRSFFFRRPATLESAAICSLPRGGGLGRGHSPNFGNLSQHSTAPIQALRLVALSLALSHGREDGAAVGIKGFARKTNCSGCFFSFQTAYNQWQTQESRRPHVGCVRYARVLHFPSNPNPPRACLAAHTLPTGSKVV